MQETLNFTETPPLQKTSVSSSFLYTIRDTECNSKVFETFEEAKEFVNERWNWFLDAVY